MKWVTSAFRWPLFQIHFGGNLLYYLQHDPVFIAPPPTEMPDYILYRQYEEPCYLPGRPSKEVFDNSGSPAFCRGYKIRRLFCNLAYNALSLDNDKE